MISFQNIELFENLSQYEYAGNFYDFHNDFDCVKISMLSKNILCLLFKKLNTKELAKMNFLNSKIEKMEFFNFPKVENLTIDNIYRGRTEINGQLADTRNNQGYFYLEFDEGQKLEFWSTGFTIQS